MHDDPQRQKRQTSIYDKAAKRILMCLDCCVLIVRESDAVVLMFVHFCITAAWLTTLKAVLEMAPLMANTGRGTISVERSVAVVIHVVLDVEVAVEEVESANLIDNRDRTRVA